MARLDILASQVVQTDSDASLLCPYHPRAVGPLAWVALREVARLVGHALHCAGRQRAFRMPLYDIVNRRHPQCAVALEGRGDIVCGEAVARVVVSETQLPVKDRG